MIFTYQQKRMGIVDIAQIGKVGGATSLSVVLHTFLNVHNKCIYYLCNFNSVQKFACDSWWLKKIFNQF